MTSTTLALLLAQTCVAEIGFQEDTRECELMWSVNQTKATLHKRTLKEQTLLFNSYWKSGIQRSRRPWIKHLVNERKPKHWPRTLSWSHWRDKWLAYKRAAIDFVTGARTKFYDCPSAIDYGAPGEIPQGKNMYPLQCLGGQTKQRYWARREGK